MVPRSLRSRLRRLLVGPGRTALRVGLPAVVAVAVVTAASTTLVLRSHSGGLYWPLDAMLVGVAASAVYAVRYRAAVVCVALGVAAFVGSDVGFHAIHGDEAAVATLARFVRHPEAVAFGVGFGAVGAAVGGVAGRVRRVRRARAA